VTSLKNLDGLAADLKVVWKDPQTDVRQKKRIVRILIQEIIADIDSEAPWLNLSHAAHHIGVSPKTLRAAIEAGEIEGIHPLPKGLWIFGWNEIGRSAAHQFASHARQNAKYPTASHVNQQSLFPSTT
jgi:hypothetical protein